MRQPVLNQRQLVISYGHSNTHVVIQLSHETNNLQLTPAECDAFLENVAKLKVMLLAPPGEPETRQQGHPAMSEANHRWTHDRAEIARRVADAVDNGWTPQVNCSTEDGGGPFSVSVSRGQGTKEPIGIIDYRGNPRRRKTD